MKRLLIIAALMVFCLGAAAQEQCYTVKSGIVTMEMDMMGQTVIQKMYFDDYGARQASISEFGGRKMRSIEEDVEIAPAMFTIPEGVEIQEMDMSRMRGGFGEF